MSELMGRGICKSNIYSLFDVAFSSAATLILSVIAARSLSIEGFGVYGIFFAITTAFQSMVQGGYIDVYLRRGKFDGGLHWRIDRFFPIVMGLGLVTIGIATRFDSYPPFLMVLTALAAVCLYVRFPWVRTSYYVRNLQNISALISGVLLVSSMGFLLLNVSLGWEGWPMVAMAFVGSYGLSGLISFVCFFIEREVPTDDNPKLWRWDYALENALLVSSMQMSSVFVTPALGLQFNAGYRGGAMLFGPITMFFSSVRLILVPYFVGKTQSKKVMIIPAASIVVVVLLWSIVVHFAATFLGEELLGESFEATRVLLFWFFLSYLSQGVYLIFFLAGRAWIMDRAVRWGRVSQMLAMFSGVFAAVMYASHEFYFLGTVIGNAVAVLIVLVSIKGANKN